MNERIVSELNVCGGEACFRGTRILVKVVLSHLAAGESTKDILSNFPALAEPDIRACLEYASYLAAERI